MATGALVNAAWDLQARRAGKPLWKLLVDLPPEELVGALDFSYVTDALTPEEAVTLLRERAAGKRERERSRPGGRLSGLHDVDRLARLPRREGAAALPGGDRRGVDGLQDEGRAGPRGQHAPGRADARGDRPRPAAHAGRQPVLGRSGGDPAGEGARRLRPVLDRGADEPRRRPRPRGDRAGRSPRSASPPARSARTGSSSSSSSRRGRSASSRSTPAAWPASPRPSW